MSHKRIPGANWQHRMADLSEWMANNEPNRIRDAAKALGWDYDNTKKVWQRIRKRLGPQAI